MAENEKVMMATAYGITGNMWNPANDMYAEFLESIRDKFNRAMSSKELGAAVFTTDAKGLFEIFLDNLPKEARQHYTCNCCRQFVERFGGLVVVQPDTGYQIPIMWNPTDAPEFFKPSVEELFKAVAKAKVNGVFLATGENMGTPVTGPWSHMSVPVHPRIRFIGRRGETLNDVIAQYKEEHGMLARALATYDQRVIEGAVHMLTVGTLAMSGEHLGKAQWFLDCKKKVSEEGINKHNMLWYLSATAPTGLCHIANSVIGTLMDDIAEGKDPYEIEQRFNNKVDPKFYQRPQAAPTAGAVAVAEKKVAELGIAPAFERRYAKLEDLETIWTPTPDGETKKSDGVFGGVVTKEKKEYERIEKGPVPSHAVKVTWEKFRREILPRAIKIEAKLGNGNLSMSALLTATNPDAPPIFKYDTMERRNPVSWYIYAEGSPAKVWGLNPYTHVPVTAVTLQPNMWGGNEDAYPSCGKGAFFILEGAKDLYGKPGLGLFPQLIKSELYDIRRVIEAYSSQNQPTGSSDATACGIRISENDCRTGVAFKVKTDIGEAYYEIDRWE